MGSNPTLSVGDHLHNYSIAELLMNKLNQVEDILCDIDGLIGAAIEAGDNENARALVEEFGEWFMDYEQNKDIEVTCLEVLEDI